MRIGASAAPSLGRGLRRAGARGRCTGAAWRCVPFPLCLRGSCAGGSFSSSSTCTDSLSLSILQNTFWVIDREKDLAFVYFSNILPYGSQQVFDLWEKLEPDLYKGLADARA